MSKAIDREKLLEWIKYGFERSTNIKEGAMLAKNDTLYNKMIGGDLALKVLQEQIEAGTFDIESEAKS